MIINFVTVTRSLSLSSVTPGRSSKLRSVSAHSLFYLCLFKGQYFSAACSKICSKNSAWPSESARSTKSSS